MNIKTQELKNKYTVMYIYGIPCDVMVGYSVSIQKQDLPVHDQH